MIALYIIASAYSCAVIATAGQVWAIGLSHGLSEVMRLAAASSRPEPPPRPTQPHKWSSDNPPAPMVRWPRDN